MQKKFATFETYVKRTFVKPGHSTDHTGMLGEDVPPYASLYLRFMEFEKDNQQTQSAAAKRRRNNDLIGLLMEQRGPLGSNGNMPPLSQVQAENERCVTTDDNASTIIVPVEAENIVGSGISPTIASPAAKKAKLDHLKKTPVNNPQLGGFLKDFMNTINEQVGQFVNNTSEQSRTKADIMKEYRDAKDDYDKAVADNNEEDKEFYKLSKELLKKEMDNFNN